MRESCGRRVLGKKRRARPPRRVAFTFLLRVLYVHRLLDLLTKRQRHSPHPHQITTTPTTTMPQTPAAGEESIACPQPPPASPPPPRPSSTQPHVACDGGEDDHDDAEDHQQQSAAFPPPSSPPPRHQPQPPPPAALLTTTMLPTAADEAASPVGAAATRIAVADARVSPLPRRLSMPPPRGDAGAVAADDAPQEPPLPAQGRRRRRVLPLRRCRGGDGVILSLFFWSCSSSLSLPYILYMTRDDSLPRPLPLPDPIRAPPFFLQTPKDESNSPPASASRPRARDPATTKLAPPLLLRFTHHTHHPGSPPSSVSLFHTASRHPLPSVRTTVKNTVWRSRCLSSSPFSAPNQMRRARQR